MWRPLLLLIPFMFLSQKAKSQRFSTKYFIGMWTAVDSSTGGKKSAYYKNYSEVTFTYKEDTSTWRYKYVHRGSTNIIKISQINLDSSVMLSNEAAIVVKSYNCHWSFNPYDYEHYLKALHDPKYFKNTQVYDKWLKSARTVYYRTKGKISNYEFNF